MRLRTRYLIALTLVATTTLCVDRAVAAGPRDPVAPTRGLVDRLSVGLRRTAAAARPVVRPRCGTVLVTVAVVPAAWFVLPRPIAPACLPLPPPTA